jgi:hypothetical protein
MTSEYQKRKESAIRHAGDWLGNHVIRDGLVRSFRFYAPYPERKVIKQALTYPFQKVAPHIETVRFGIDSTYAYTLTWTPGQLVLTGDIGELTLTHYHAMPTFEKMLDWAKGSDFDYLLGKSDKRRKFDADKTAKQIWGDVIEPLWDHWLGNARAYQNPYRWERRLSGGINGELRGWRKCTVGEEPECDYEDEAQKQGDRPGHETGLEFERGHKGDFCLFIRLFEHINGYGPELEDLLIAARRNRLRDELPSHCENQHAAVTICQALHMDDYYGSEEWGEHELFQIAAIQHGLAMIRAQLGLDHKLEAAE